MPTTDAGPIPRRLSQTGAFRDVRTLKVADGLLAYDINVAFWSDGAAKRRWMALPTGTKIGFAPTGEWTFPPGTVFVKHFEMPAAGGRGGASRRIETRLLIRDAAGGVYGASYKWRADNSDADLLDDGRTETIDVGASDASPQTMLWTFPSRADCRTCHTPAAGFVLGVKTRQIHRDVRDAQGGACDQLLAWTNLGLFDRAPDEQALAALPALRDANDVKASVELRARSFLDANCAQCHRPGGVTGQFDARFDTPLDRQNLIDGPVLINLGIDRARVIAPNDPWRSILLARLTDLEQPKMPPLAHNAIDARGVALIKEWIASLGGSPVVAPPEFEPKGGDFKQPVKVTLRSADPAAEVRYTLDGSPPTKSSSLYSGPVKLTGPTTVRARAFKSGATRSIIAQETFIIEN